MSVGELFAWGSSTEGRVHSVDTHRSLRIGGLKGAFGQVVALHDGQGTGLLGDCGLSGVEGIEDVAIGAGHTLAILTDGRVLASGEGQHGELGLGAKVLSSPQARPITALEGKRVCAVACGAQHSAAVTKCGDVYTWGAGFHGQTGHASDALDEDHNAAATGVQLLPKVVGHFVGRHRVVAVACGDRHTAVVTVKGQVWCWGEGKCGQLGIGKVSRRGRPVLTLEACPATGAPLETVSCGWGHTLALSAQGTVAAWGFNAFGQLGLGHKDAVFFPEAMDFPAPRSGGEDADPVRITQVVACGNFSGAITDAQEVYTWGCDSVSGRLGHGALSNGARRSVFKPVMVAALTGKQVAALALSTTDVFAFVPSVVYRVDPPCGPLSGGTRVHVHGGGFWDDESIVVRFASIQDLPSTPGKSTRRKQEASVSKPVPRAAMGQFMQDADASTGAPQVLWCRAPRAQVTGPAEVEVAMNGEDFTCNKIHYSYYKEPVLSSISPAVFSAAHPCPFTIRGEHLQETGLIRVKFKEKTPGTRESIVHGHCEHRLTGAKVLNPETEEYEEGRVSVVTCPSPEFDGSFPVEVRVAIALNGVDFVFLQGATIVAHNASTKRASPSSIPAEENTFFQIEGTSFFPSSALKVRLSVLAEGSLLDTNAAADQPPTVLHVCDGEAHFLSTEAVRVTLPRGLLTNTPNQLGDLNLDEEALATAEGKRIDDLFPPSCLSIALQAEVSIDGNEFLAKPVRVMLYRPAVFEPTPGHELLGPFTGATPVELACDGALFDSDEVQVHFDASVVSGGKSTTVPAELSTDPSSGRSVIKCVTPDMAVNRSNTEAEAQVHSIPVRISLNGRDLLPHEIEFGAYFDPVVNASNVDECHACQEIELSGTGLLSCQTGKVKLRFKSCEMVVDDAVFTEESIVFSMPDLAAAIPPANGENEEQDEGGEAASPGAGGEEAEDRAFSVEVLTSINGVNFTMAGVSLVFNPEPQSEGD